MILFDWIFLFYFLFLLLLFFFWKGRSSFLFFRGFKVKFLGSSYVLEIRAGERGGIDITEEAWDGQRGMIKREKTAG